MTNTGSFQVEGFFPFYLFVCLFFFGGGVSIHMENSK